MGKITLRNLPLWVGLAGMLLACSNQKAEAPLEKSFSASSASAEASVADTAAANPEAYPDRQFIRTADLRYRVTDVAQTTHTIEDLTARYGGFITQNHLASTVQSTRSVQISADSLLETTEYRVENNLILRIPNQRLDELLRQLGKDARFLDYRVVNGDEVSLQLLSNQLRAQRTKTSENRIQRAIDRQGKKLGETLQGEQDLRELQERTDAQTIERLSLNDQVQFSTVKLHLYQRNSIQRETIAVPTEIPVYQPLLSQRLREAFLSGWVILEDLLVFFARLWALGLLGFVGWLVYRRYGLRLMGK